MKTMKSILAVLLTATFCFLVFPSQAGSASGGGGGGGGAATVAGPCGTVTSISASTVELTGSGSSYTASPLQIKGNVFNCSIYFQGYWIEFDEPTNVNATCKANFWLFGALWLSSGSSQGWTATSNIAPNGVTNPASCVGTHTVRVILRDRAFGNLMQTLYVNYSVVLK